MKFLAIIPSRYGSTRFPGKPLALLAGKPIVERVYERVATVFDHLCVATDDERISSAVEAFGGVAVLTSTEHRSGTDRCREALEKMEAKTGLKFDVVVNVQGDEPFIAPSQLQNIRSAFDNAATQIATLVKPFAPDTPFDTLANPNSPKVVVDAEGRALYFSRSVIPYLRDAEPSEWAAKHRYLKHIGLYAYRADVLARITALPAGELERCESLEQLRWLQAGFTVQTIETDEETIGIDTPADLERAEKFFAKVISKN